MQRSLSSSNARNRPLGLTAKLVTVAPRIFPLSSKGPPLTDVAFLRLAMVPPLASQRTCVTPVYCFITCPERASTTIGSAAKGLTRRVVPQLATKKDLGSTTRFLSCFHGFKLIVTS